MKSLTGNFKCSTCGVIKHINSMVFLKYSDKPTEYFCRVHLNCASCKEKISDNNVIRSVGDRVYHATNNCFSCTQCKLLLTKDRRPRFSSNGKLYCDTHATCYFCHDEYKLQDLCNLKFEHCWIKSHKLCLANANCRVCYTPLLNEFDTKQRGIHKRCVENDPICFYCNTSVKQNRHQAYIISKVGSVSVHMHTDCKQKNICSFQISPGLTCADPRIDIRKLYPEQWMSSNHQKYPNEIKSALFTVLCAWRLRNTVFSKMPKDALFYLFNWIATIDGWKTFNGLTKICTPWICASNKNRNCNVCKSAILIIPKSNSCTQKVCAKYAFKCKICHYPIPFNVDPVTCCTTTRCISQKCKMCKGELKFGNDDNRALCTLNDCVVYLRECIFCYNSIKRDASNYLNECTTYRCLKEWCRSCGNPLAPESNGWQMCTKEKCFTDVFIYKSITESLIKFLLDEKYDLPMYAKNNPDFLVKHVLAYLAHLLDEKNPKYEKLLDIYKLWEVAARSVKK